MNETVYNLLCIITCCFIAFVVYIFAKHLGKRGAQTDIERTEELERRAGDNNQRLADAERTTRETIERAAETARRTEELIRVQAGDNRRAAENNQRAGELIKRAEEILGKDDD